jgi:hypothetical protein
LGSVAFEAARMQQPSLAGPKIDNNNNNNNTLASITTVHSNEIHTDLTAQ